MGTKLKQFSTLIIRYNFLCILVCILVLPGPLALYTHFAGKKHTFKWAVANYRLYGVTSTLEKPLFDWQHVRDHSVQKYLEANSSNHLALRSWLIRAINQTYFSLFKKSYAYHNSIIIGKQGQLFEKFYIETYCGLMPLAYENTAALTEWANKLKKISDFLTVRGKLFLYLITPNKALYVPNAIPNRYHCQDHETQHIKQLEQLLDQRQVKYVNLIESMQIATQQYNHSLFPQGGTHWNLLGAAVGANQIIAHIQQNSPLHLIPIEYKYFITYKPHGTDHDLLSLMNLMKPNKHYSVPQLVYSRLPTFYPHTTISLIGGSFVNQLLSVFQSNKTFGKMNFYFYFKVSGLFYDKDQVKWRKSVNATSKEVIDNIVASDIIVLEENAANTISNHGQLFYDTLFSYYKIF